MNSDTNEIRSILIDQANKLFTDHATKDVIDEAEKGNWPTALWQALEENGLTRAAVPEAHDGAGATLSDAMAVLRQAGGFAAPVPFAETVIAGWLLGRCGITPPEGAISFASLPSTDNLTLKNTSSGWTVTGALTAVPWGRESKTIVASASDDRGENQRRARV